MRIIQLQINRHADYKGMEIERALCSQKLNGNMRLSEEFGFLMDYIIYIIKCVSSLCFCNGGNFHLIMRSTGVCTGPLQITAGISVSSTRGIVKRQMYCSNVSVSFILYLFCSPNNYQLEHLERKITF